MAAVVFALLLSHELASKVHAFRQVRRSSDHLLDAFSQVPPQNFDGHEVTGHELDDAESRETDDVFNPQDERTSELSQLRMTEHSATYVKGGIGRDADEEDECNAKMKPRDTLGWWEMAHQDRKNFFLCLNNEKKKLVFLNAIHALTSLEATHVPEVKEKLGLNRDAYTLEVGDEENMTHYFVYTQKTKGDASIEKLVKYTEGTNLDELLGNSSCAAGAQCSFLEVAKEDLVCVDNSGETSVDGCKKRVAKLIYELGKEELEEDGAFTSFSLFNQQFSFWKQSVDGDKTAYCKFGEIMEGYIDPNKPQIGQEGKPSSQCLMVACSDHEGIIPYEKWYKCTFGMSKVKAFPAILLFLLVWFLQMGVLADGYLVPALVKIGRGLHMSDALLGATLLALGGAANDFMAGLASALAEIGKFNKAKKEEKTTGIPMDERSLDEVELWLGGVFGTGFFVNTLVAALVMIFAPAAGIPVKHQVIMRDICFRILAVSTMIVFGCMKTITPVHCVVMISMYLVYVALTLHEANQRKNEEEASMEVQAQSAGGQMDERADVATCGSRPALSRHSILSFTKHEGGALEKATDAPELENKILADLPIKERIAHHMGYDPYAGVMDQMGFVAAFIARPFFALTLATNSWDPVVSPLLPLGMGIFFPFGSKGLFEAILKEETFTDTFYMWECVISTSLGAVLSAVVFFMSMRSGKTEYLFPMTYAWATFVMCILWLGLLANEILDALGCTAEMFNISKINAGITFLAWGNCIDNVFATIGLAKAQEFGVAITGIYAAPMFNVLFGQGITLLFVTTMKIGHKTDFVMSTSALIILCSLVIILIGTLLYTKFCNWRMTRSLGVALAICYPTVLLASFAVGNKFDTNK